MNNIIIAKEILRLAKEIMAIDNPDGTGKWNVDGKGNGKGTLTPFTGIPRNNGMPGTVEENKENSLNAVELLRDQIAMAYMTANTSNPTPFPEGITMEDMVKLIGSDAVSDGRSFIINVPAVDFYTVALPWIIKDGKIAIRIKSCNELNAFNDEITSLDGFPESAERVILRSHGIKNLLEIKDASYKEMYIHACDMDSLVGVPSTETIYLMECSLLKDISAIKQNTTKIFISKCDKIDLSTITEEVKNKLNRIYLFRMNLDAKKFLDCKFSLNTEVFSDDEKFVNELKKNGYDARKT